MKPPQEDSPYQAVTGIVSRVKKIEGGCVLSLVNIVSDTRVMELLLPNVGLKQSDNIKAYIDMRVDIGWPFLSDEENRYLQSKRREKLDRFEVPEWVERFEGGKVVQRYFL